VLLRCVGNEEAECTFCPTSIKKVFLNSYFILDDWTEEVCMTSKYDLTVEQILYNRTKKNTSCMVVVFCYERI